VVYCLFSMFTEEKLFASSPLCCSIFTSVHIGTFQCVTLFIMSCCVQNVMNKNTKKLFSPSLLFRQNATRNTKLFYALVTICKEVNHLSQVNSAWPSFMSTSEIWEVPVHRHTMRYISLVSMVTQCKLWTLWLGKLLPDACRLIYTVFPKNWYTKLIQ